MYYSTTEFKYYTNVGIVGIIIIIILPKKTLYE